MVSPPPPIEKAEGRDRRRALGTPSRCGPEGNKQTKKTFGIDTIRPVIAIKGLQLQYNLPPTQEKLKAHFTILINQSMKVRKYDEYAAFSF